MLQKPQARLLRSAGARPKEAAASDSPLLAAIAGCQPLQSFSSPRLDSALFGRTHDLDDFLGHGCLLSSHRSMSLAKRAFWVT